MDVDVTRSKDSSTIIMDGCRSSDSSSGGDGDGGDGDDVIVDCQSWTAW
jgi:hypothetical protein